MEDSLFWSWLTMLICFGFAFGLLFSLYKNWRIWKALSIPQLLLGIGTFIFGVIILIKFII